VDLDTLAKRLKYARDLKGLTQEELAQMAKTTQDVITKIEQGKTKQPRSIEQIAKVLNKSAAWLLFGMEDSHKVIDLEEERKLENKVPTESKIESLAREKAIEFADKYERHLNVTFEPAEKMALFDMMTERYRRLLSEGQVVPVDKGMDAEVIEFSKIQRIRAKK